MDNITDWLDVDNINLINFYGYTSKTTFRLYEIEQNDIEGLNEIEEHILQVADKIKQQVKDSGLRWDNKVVVEVTVLNSLNETVTLYFGYYDLRVSIGLGVQFENDYISLENK